MQGIGTLRLTLLSSDDTLLSTAAAAASFAAAKLSTPPALPTPTHLISLSTPGSSTSLSVAHLTPGSEHAVFHFQRGGLQHLARLLLQCPSCIVSGAPPEWMVGAQRMRRRSSVGRNTAARWRARVRSTLYGKPETERESELHVRKCSIEKTGFREMRLRCGRKEVRHKRQSVLVLRTRLMRGLLGQSGREMNSTYRETASDVRVRRVVARLKRRTGRKEMGQSVQCRVKLQPSLFLTLFAFAVQSHSCSACTCRRS